MALRNSSTQLLETTVIPRNSRTRIINTTITAALRTFATAHSLYEKWSISMVKIDFIDLIVRDSSGKASMSHMFSKMP